MGAHPIDPISVAVIANRLTAITKEMGQIMLLTSRSPIFSESRDFVTAIFDAQGQLIAQTAYIPVLLGAIPFAMEAIRRKYQDEELHPGDVIVANDPYDGNSLSRLCKRWRAVGSAKYGLTFISTTKSAL